MKSPIVVAAAAAIALVMVTAGTARADSKADILFKKGKKLLAQKRYADACDAFEKSNKLDPGIGAVLNVAKCYEEWGKIATAFRYYSDAETMARDAKDPRVPKIHERVAKLEGVVPRLTVRAPSGADTSKLDVTVDGIKLDTAQLGEPQVVDPGPHLVEYRAGDTKKSKVVPVERGGSSDIMLDLPKTVAKVEVPTKPDKPAPAKSDGDTKPDKTAVKVDPIVHVDANPGHGRRVMGVVVGTAGVVAMGVAGYLTFSARSSYNDALTAHCGGDKTSCDAEGLTLTHDARSKANLATIVVGAGGAVTLLGVILYVTAPSSQPSGEHALRLTPNAGPGTVGVLLDGRF